MERALPLSVFGFSTLREAERRWISIGALDDERTWLIASANSEILLSFRSLAGDDSWAPPVASWARSFVFAIQLRHATRHQISIEGVDQARTRQHGVFSRASSPNVFAREPSAAGLYPAPHQLHS